MSQSKSTKNKKSKPNTQVTIAVITLIGTLVTAILASPLLIALVHKQPTLTITPTIENTATLPPITPTSTIVPFRFDWFGTELNQANFYTDAGKDKVDLNITDDGLYIYGTWINLSRIRVNKTLPRDFGIDLEFVALQNDCALSVGFDDGKNWLPSYHIALSTDWTSFKKFIEGDDLNYYISPKNTQYPMQDIGSSRLVTLERVDGAIKAWIDNILVIELEQDSDPEMSGINDYNVLEFSAVSNSNETCSFLIKRFSVRNP